MSRSSKSIYIIKDKTLRKKCSKCEVNKPLSHFSKNKDKKDGHSSHCKECNKVYNKKHYNDNKSDYLHKNDNRKKLLKRFVNSIKEEAKCSRCPEDDIACLDFHHIDDKNKDFSISLGVNSGFSIENLQREIDKCEILCSNCHRKIHYYQQSQ